MKFNMQPLKSNISASHNYYIDIFRFKKNTIKQVFLLLIMVFLFNSCRKEEDDVNTITVVYDGVSYKAEPLGKVGNTSCSTNYTQNISSEGDGPLFTLRNYVNNGNTITPFQLAGCNLCLDLYNGSTIAGSVSGTFSYSGGDLNMDCIVIDKLGKTHTLKASGRMPE